MKLDKKLKNNRGSALILAIVGIALVSICTIAISFQINSQIKSNNTSYENLKYKYMAEAGIEKAIYEVERDIKSKIPYKVMIPNKTTLEIIKSQHISCPKVKFDENGKPNIQDEKNGFNQLILEDMLKDRIEHDSYYSKVLFNDLRFIIGDIEANNLKLYYETNISILLKTVFTNSASYNDIQIKSNIDTFISKIDEVKLKVNDQQIINDLNQIKEWVIEIKCRLGMLGGNVEVGEKVSIVVPQYTVKLKKDDELDFSSEDETVELYIKRNEYGELQEIVLDSLNSQKIVSKSGYKIIESKIKFTFIKYDNGYDIVQDILLYEQK